LLEQFVLLPEEVQEGIYPLVPDELPLQVYPIEQHGWEGYHYLHGLSPIATTYQFLVDLRQLVEGLDDPRDDLLLDDLLTAVHLHAQIGYSGHYVSKDLPLSLLHQHFEKYLQEPLLAQMRDYLGVLGKVADQLYHESKQVCQLFVPVEVNARLEAILECGYLGLLHKVLVQACLRSHVAESDTCALNNVDLAPFSAIQ
jgi:hypothetical protein